MEDEQQPRRVATGGGSGARLAPLAQRGGDEPSAAAAAAAAATPAAAAAAAAAAADDADNAAPAPTAAPAAPAAAATDNAAPPPDPSHQQRVLGILALVLRRQRQRAREARQAQRREFLAAAEALPSRRAWIEYNSGGCVDDDGEGGAVAGGGWRKDQRGLCSFASSILGRAAHSSDVGFASDGSEPSSDGWYWEYEDEDEDERIKTDSGDKEDTSSEQDDDGGGSGRTPWKEEKSYDCYYSQGDDDDGRGALPEPPKPAESRPAAEREFFDTVAAAAGVCKAWRSIALGAVDRVSILLPKNSDSRLLRRERRWPPMKDPPKPRDPLHLLQQCDGGSLRALRVSGSLESGPLSAGIARALGLVGGVEPDPRLARALGGIKLLHVENAYDLREALAKSSASSALPSRKRRQAASPARGDEEAEDGQEEEQQAGAAAAIAASFLRHPAPVVFTALVHLELDLAPSSYRRPPLTLSRRTVPALRSLRAMIHPGANVPLRLGGGGGSFTDRLPPQLTLLDVAPTLEGCPPGDYGVWPAGSPLLVSPSSLPALGPTLLQMRVDCTWVASLPTDRPLLMAARAAADLDAASVPHSAQKAVDALLASVRRAPGAPPDGDVAPLSRLVPAFAQLSRLTALKLDSDYDFEEAPVWLPKKAQPGPREARRARKLALQVERRRDWAAAARLLARPSAASLASLQIGIDSYGYNRRDVHLPPALSMLSALSSLEVAGHRVCSVGPGLRTLTNLRRLSIETAFPERNGHGPVFPRDLVPLTALESLRLAEAPACLAPLISGGLPRLRFLTLRNRRSHKEGGAPSWLPSAAVLRAARTRMQSEGLLVFYALGRRHSWAPGPVSEGDLAHAEGQAARRASEQKHAQRHARGLAAADAREASYVG